MAALFLCGAARGQSTLFTFQGDSAGDQFGWCIAGAGDVNNDGYADVVVGARWDDNSGPNSGMVRVFNGRTGAVLYTWNGGAQYDHLGTSVAAAGDVDNDGFDDLLIGADATDVGGSSSGSVQVRSGRTGVVLGTYHGSAANDIFGTSCAGVGDVNNDGRPDFIVGAPWNDNNHGTDAGAARVISGANGQTLYTFIGDATSDYFGFWVAGAGDVNHDGRPDMIVGAPYGDVTGSAAGYARVFSGANGSVLYTFRGDTAGDNLGYMVASAGDVDGDLYADVIAGAPYDDLNGSASGSAKVFSGRTGTVLHVFKGDQANDLLGISVAAAGDVDADGHADLMVGALWDDNTAVNAGSMRVFSGFDGKVLFTLNGDYADDQFGFCAAAVGDANGDGMPDFVGSSYLADPHGSSSGMTRLFSPYPEPVVAYCTAKVNTLGCTPTISSSGSPRFSGNQAFWLRASNERSDMLGSLTYGFTPHVMPFQGGYLCMEQPLKRTALQNSGGSPGNNCTGNYAYDFNARIHSGVDPALTAGTFVAVQYWSRDPGAQGNSNTTSALRFVINP